MTESHSTYVSKRRASPWEAEHHLFAWLAGSIVLLVFVGFARTYYLHSFFGMPALTRFLHLHGAVMTGWIVVVCGSNFPRHFESDPHTQNSGGKGAKQEETFQNSLNFTLSSECLRNSHRLCKRTVTNICAEAIL